MRRALIAAMLWRKWFSVPGERRDVGRPGGAAMPADEENHGF